MKTYISTLSSSTVTICLTKLLYLKWEMAIYYLVIAICGHSTHACHYIYTTNVLLHGNFDGSLDSCNYDFPVSLSPLS
jgi:hypothetical protein